MNKRFLIASMASIVLFVCLSSFVDKGKPASNSGIKQANIEALTGVSADTDLYASSLIRETMGVTVTVELDGQLYSCIATRAVTIECEGKGNFPCTLGEVRYKDVHNCTPVYIAR